METSLLAVGLAVLQAQEILAGEQWHGGLFWFGFLIVAGFCFLLIVCDSK